VPSSIAVAYWAYGLAFAVSDAGKSLSAWQLGLALARRSGNRFWETVIAIDIANLQAKAGEGKAALTSFRDLLAMSGGLRDSFFVASGLSALILLFDRLGCFEGGAILYGALPKLIERGAYLDGLDEALTRARSGLGDAAFEAAIQVGTAMTLQEASEFARGEIDKALQEF
jgi:hypothetical protein